MATLDALSPKGRVRWLKALYGLPSEGGFVSVNSRARGTTKLLGQMGQEISDTENALAVYITLNARRHNEYYDSESTPGSIAGLVWLGTMSLGSSTASQQEDQRFDSGWPISRVLRKQGPDLDKLLRDCYGTGAHLARKRLTGYFHRSAPISLDDLFPELGETLRTFIAPPVLEPHRIFLPTAGIEAIGPNPYACTGRERGIEARYGSTPSVVRRLREQIRCRQ